MATRFETHGSQSSGCDLTLPCLKVITGVLTRTKRMFSFKREKLRVTQEVPVFSVTSVGKDVFYGGGFNLLGDYLEN